MAIISPTKLKATVITKRGWSIEISIEGDASLLMLAGWCKVFHQSTENLIIGRLIEPIRINIAIVFSLTSLFSKVWFRKIINKYTINKIATDVNLASHTHQVPHIGFPHIDPENKHNIVNTAPIGAIALLIMKLNGIKNQLWES